MSTTSTARLLVKKITPECNNSAGAIKISGAVVIILAVILLILLIVSLVYTYQNTKDSGDSAVTADDNGTTDNSKISGILQIICVIVSALLAVVGIWHVLVGNKFVKCINANSN